MTSSKSFPFICVCWLHTGSHLSLYLSYRPNWFLWGMQPNLFLYFRLLLEAGHVSVIIVSLLFGQSFSSRQSAARGASQVLVRHLFFIFIFTWKTTNRGDVIVTTRGGNSRKVHYGKCWWLNNLLNCKQNAWSLRFPQCSRWDLQVFYSADRKRLQAVHRISPHLNVVCGSQNDKSSLFHPLTGLSVH